MSYEDLNEQLEPFKLMVFDEGTEDVWATLVLWLNEDYKQNVFDNAVCRFRNEGRSKGRIAL